MAGGQTWAFLVTSAGGLERGWGVLSWVVLMGGRARWAGVWWGWGGWWGEFWGWGLVVGGGWGGGWVGVWGGGVVVGGCGCCWVMVWDSFLGPAGSPCPN